MTNDILSIVRTTDPATLVDMTAVQDSSLKAPIVAQGLAVSSDAEESGAADFLAHTSAMAKAVEALRKEKVTPLNDLVKGINALFKPLTTALEDADKIMTQKLLDYRKRKEQIRIEEEKRREAEFMMQAEAAKAKADAEHKAYVPPPPPPVVLPPVNKVRGEAGAIQMRKTWTFRILDMTKIPEHYFELNRSLIDDKIASIVKAKGDPTHAIPGVEAYQEESIVRGRT